MSLFRSEEHALKWIQVRHYERGEIISLAQVWKLAKAWFIDPRDPDWVPRSREATQAVLTSVGLTSEFWKFA